MLTLGNLKFVASQTATALQVAALFRGKSSGITPTTLLGTMTGTLSQWNSTSDITNGSQVTFTSNVMGNVSSIVYKNKISNFTLADVIANKVSFYNGSENTMPSFTAKVTDTVAGLDSLPITSNSGFVATGTVFTNNPGLHSGLLIFGDASGGGGGGPAWSSNSGISGVNGSAAPDTLTGTAYEDIVFGDGSGGGAGSVITIGNNTSPGAGGGAPDNISGGAGNDILFGDGFSGSYTPGTSSSGTNGGYGGGGGGGNNRTGSSTFGKGGVGGGEGYSGNILPGDTVLPGSASTIGFARTGLPGNGGSSGNGGGGGGGVSATGSEDTNPITAGLDPLIYNKVIADLGNPNSDIFNQVMGNGDDTIDGGAGDDWIMGGFGNDLITGGSGNDNLWGRGGTNTIVKSAYSYTEGTPNSFESASFTFMPTDTLNAGNSLSVAGLTITAISDIDGQQLANALSNISTGGSGTSTTQYTISGNLTSGWKSNTVTGPSGSFAFYTVKFQTNVNGSVVTNPGEMTQSKTTFNMTDNDTFKWNTGDAVSGSLSTDTIKDFSAWIPNTSKGDKIDISDLLRGLGYRSGLVLTDWVSFTQAIGGNPAEINIDTGVDTSVIQKIVLDSANLGTNTSLQNLIDNRVLIT